MEAVIVTGGKQYVVKEGDEIAVEKVTEKTLKIVPLLVTNDGKTITTKAPAVTASVIGETKVDKIVVFKMKAKKRYRVKQGHRQRQSTLKIEKITA